MPTSVFSILIRAGLVALVLLLLDWYVFQAVKIAFQRVSFRNWIYFFYWSAYISFIVLVAVGLAQPSLREGKGQQIIQFIMGFFVFWYVPKLIVVLFLLGEDIFRVTRGLASQIASPEYGGNESVFLITRSEFLSRLGILLVTIPMAAVGYGIVRGRYQFRVRKVNIFFPNLPDSFDGFTIAQISDIHIGSFSDTTAIAEGISMVNQLKPDIITFTGDLVNNRADEIEPFFNILSNLKSKYGNYSVLGNHDYGDYVSWPSREAKKDNLDRLIKYHQELGFQLLLNSGVEIERNGEKIGIAGVENWGLPPFPQKGNIAQAINQISDTPFRILLSHDPTHFDEVITKSKDKYRADLTLSGHTHGLQFGIELGNIRWSPVKYKYPKWADLYQVENQYLYVNRGFGFIGFPGRVGILPEITHITLHKTKTLS